MLRRYVAAVTFRREKMMNPDMGKKIPPEGKPFGGYFRCGIYSAM